MAKYLKDVLGKNTTTKKTNDLGVYKPKAGDEQKFVKKHEIEMHDHTPAPEHQFSGGKSEAPYKKQSDGVYESKKAEDVLCNSTSKGTECPVHGIAECMSARPLKELSTDLLHRAAHKAAKVAMTDVQGRSGPIFKKRAAQANKFRDKGMAQEKKEKAAKAVKEAYDDNSSNVSDWSNKKLKWHKEKQSSSSAKAHSELVRRSKTGQATKFVKEESLDEISDKLALSYAKGASKSMDTAAAKGSAGHETFMKRNAGHALALDKTNPEHKRLKAKVGTSDANAKDAAYKKAIGEGANVDRMVAHIKSSEKSAGKSDKKAENIAWATANKRGMLDNKNKKSEKIKAYRSDRDKHMEEAYAVEPLLGGSSSSDESVEMVKAELKALANKAMHLVMQMPASMHVEPWCQAKIANAKSYVNDVHDYMIYGDHKEEDESDTPMDITTASNPSNALPNQSVDVGRNV